MNQNTISARYRQALDILSKLPAMLLGLSVLAMAISAYTMRSVIMWIIPLAVIPVAFSIGAGLCGVFLNAVRGESYDIMTLFRPFESWDRLKRIVGGMCWMLLLVYLWSIIPAAVITAIFALGTLILSFAFDTGFFAVIFALFMVVLWIAASVMAMIKGLEFCFTPYILISHPEIKATDAVKESSRLTKGLKASLFGAQILPVLVYIFVVGVLGALTALPLIGWLFGAALVVVELAFSILLTLFSGLVTAGFYNEAEKSCQ